MNRKFIEMAIEGMDPDEILEKFNHLCSHGNDPDCMIRFLEYLLPLYERKKEEALTKVIRETYTSLIDGIWEDPGDLYLYGRLNELKKLAEHLNIKIEKEDASKK